MLSGRTKYPVWVVKSPVCLPLVYLYNHINIYLSSYLSIHPSIYLFTYLLIYLSPCLKVIAPSKFMLIKSPPIWINMVSSARFPMIVAWQSSHINPPLQTHIFNIHSTKKEDCLNPQRFQIYGAQIPQDAHVWLFNPNFPIVSWINPRCIPLLVKSPSPPIFLGEIPMFLPPRSGCVARR